MGPCPQFPLTGSSANYNGFCTRSNPRPVRCVRRNLARPLLAAQTRVVRAGEKLPLQRRVTLAARYVITRFNSPINKENRDFGYRGGRFPLLYNLTRTLIYGGCWEQPSPYSSPRGHGAARGERAAGDVWRRQTHRISVKWHRSPSWQPLVAPASSQVPARSWRARLCPSGGAGSRLALPAGRCLLLLPFIHAEARRNLEAQPESEMKTQRELFHSNIEQMLLLHL